MELSIYEQHFLAWFRAQNRASQVVIAVLLRARGRRIVRYWWRDSYDG